MDIKTTIDKGLKMGNKMAVCEGCGKDVLHCDIHLHVESGGMEVCVSCLDAMEIAVDDMLEARGIR